MEVSILLKVSYKAYTCVLDSRDLKSEFKITAYIYASYLLMILIVFRSLDPFM